MAKKKNRCVFFSILIITVIISFGLINRSVIDISKIRKAGDDFHYNTISVSAIIGGFLFTGISILVSVLENKRIKRLWDFNYLDNVYHSAFVGMIANILTIVCALAILICNIDYKTEDILIHIEIITLILSIVFFSWCIYWLIFVISKLKEDKSQSIDPN